MGYHQDCTIAGRNWLRQAWGGSSQCDRQQFTLLIGLGKHGAVLISVIDSIKRGSAVEFPAGAMGS